MTLRVVSEAALVRVEVMDSSRGFPAPRAPDVGDESGRGLVLIASLADRWGITQLWGNGKIVWFELAILG
jgi:hypothetical protein